MIKPDTSTYEAAGWTFGTEVINDMPLKTVQEMYVIESGPKAGEVAYRPKQVYDYEQRKVKTFMWAQHESLPLNRQGNRSYIVGDTWDELLERIAAPTPTESQATE